MTPQDPEDNLEQIHRLEKLGVILRRSKKSGRVLLADVTPATSFRDENFLDLLGCPKLRELNLAGCSLTDAICEPLQQLTDLKSLDLQRTQVTDAVLAVLVTLPQLKLVDLSNTAASLEAIRDYRKKMIRTRIVYLA